MADIPEIFTHSIPLPDGGHADMVSQDQDGIVYPDPSTLLIDPEDDDDEPDHRT